MKTKLLLTALLLCSTPVPAAAAGSEPGQTAGPAYRLGDVVVTATRSERSPDELFADVDILTEDDIALAPSTNVDDMLRRFSGIDMTRPSDMGVTFPMSIAIRGVNGPNRVLFMVDGVPLNSALSGFIVPGQIQLSSIERVELVKGAFSSLYGSNAMGGVINIITGKRREEGRDVRTWGKYGSDAFREAGARLEGKAGKLTYSLDGSYRDINNHYRTDRRIEYSYDMIRGRFKRSTSSTANADFHDGRVAARLDYDISRDSGISFSGSYSENHTGMGKTLHLKQDRDKDTDQTFYFLNFSGHTTLGGVLALEGRLYTNYDRTEAIGENIAEHQGLFSTRYSYEYGDRYYWGRDTGAQIKGALPLGTYGYLTCGYDLSYRRAYWKNRGERNAVIGTVMDESLVNQAVYFQYEAEPLKALTVTLGGRLDFHSESEDSFSPKIGILYRLSDRIKFRGSAGRAFRAPNLGELYQPTWQMIPGIPFESNPGLDPEVIWSYDAGIDIGLSRWLSFELTGFYTDAEDLITPVISAGRMRYQNVDEVETDGFEAGITGSPYGWLSYYANYTYTHAVDRDEGRLGDIPLHRINAGVRVSRQVRAAVRLSASLDARFTDTLFYRDRMTKNLLELDSHTVLDCSLQLAFKRWLLLKAVVTNVTDERYEQHNADAGPERAFWMKVEYRFGDVPKIDR